MGVTTPIGNEKEYDHWAAIELSFKRGDIGAFYQYDFSVNRLQEAYWKYAKTDGDSAWNYSLRAGKFLNSVFDSLPGQKSNPLTRGLGAADNFTIWPIGLRADANWKGARFSLAHTVGDNIIALVSNGEVYLFWEKRVGPGVMVKPLSNSNVINPACVIAWQDEDAWMSLQNTVRLPRKLLLCSQIDYSGETERVEELVGLSYPYSKNSHFKLFYDSVRRRSCHGELTFAF